MIVLNEGLFSSKTDLWETPWDFFKDIDGKFKFTLDPCATPYNAKCSQFFTKEIDGLSQDWSGHIVFCNPPYGKEIPKWVKKCSEESLKPNTTIVALLPARTDTRWFHDYIYGKAKEIRFIKGRIKFLPETIDRKSSTAPFPSMLIIF